MDARGKTFIRLCLKCNPNRFFLLCLERFHSETKLHHLDLLVKVCSKWISADLHFGFTSQLRGGAKQRTGCSVCVCSNCSLRGVKKLNGRLWLQKYGLRRHHLPPADALCGLLDTSHLWRHLLVKERSRFYRYTLCTLLNTGNDLLTVFIDQNESMQQVNKNIVDPKVTELGYEWKRQGFGSQLLAS